MGKASQRRAAESAVLVQDELEIAAQRSLDGGAAKFAVALGGMRVSDREKRAGHRNRIIHPRALADPPVIDVAAGIARRDRRDEILLRWRKPHGAEMKPCRH